MDEKDTIFINIDTPMIPYNGNSIIFIVDGKILVTDMKLNITKKGENLDFESIVTDIQTYDDMLLYTDISDEIKVLNMTTLESIKIKYNNVKSINDKIQAASLFVENGNIITTAILAPKIDFEKIILARKVSTEGNFLAEYILDKSEIDLIWNKEVDYTFCTSYKGELYFSFVYSPYVFKYNSDGEFETKYKLNNGNYIYNKAAISNPYNLISRQELLIHEDNIFQIVNAKEKAILIKYNLNFIPQELYQLDIPISDLGYRLFWNDNNMVVQSISGISFFSFVD